MSKSRSRGCITVVAVLLSLTCTVAWADLVEFVTQQILNGPNVRVQVVGPNRLTLVLGGPKEPQTTIVVDRDRVRGFRVDIDQRLQELRGENAASGAYLQLAQICLAANQPKEAVTAFREALVAAPPIPDEQLLPIAAFFEQQEQWLDAAKLYEKYAGNHPGRQDLSERAEQLKKKASAVAQQETPRPTPVATPRAAEAPPIEKIPVVHVDGMEVQNPQSPWVSEDWANAATVQGVTLEAEGENKVLEVNVQANDKDKAAVRRAARLDLADKTQLTFDAYVDETNSPVRVAVAFITYPGWKFFESSQTLVRPDKRWTPITVDLNTPNFKCEATNWRFESSVENCDNVQQVLLLIYNTAPCKVYIDNVFFKDAEEAPTAKP